MTLDERAAWFDTVDRPAHGRVGCERVPKRACRADDGLVGGASALGRAAVAADRHGVGIGVEGQERGARERERAGR